jgi:hypothetical protein
MAHREQHGHRETKKPKKDKPHDNDRPQAGRWVVSEALEARAGSKPSSQSSK